MADIFISYKREERARIVPLAQALEALGYTVWWDRELVAGEAWKERIKTELDAACCVIVTWSKLSVGPKGLYATRWIEMEAEDGYSRGVLVPALLDSGRVAWEHRRVQFADLTQWVDEITHVGFVALVEGVRRVAGPRVRPSGLEVAAWSAVEEAPDLDRLTKFLDAYPQSRFAEIARERIGHLEVAAHVAQEGGGRAGGEARYKALLEVAERGAAENPTSSEAQRSLSLGSKSLGDVLVESGDLAGAKERYLVSLEIADLVEEPWSDEVRKELSLKLEELGDHFLDVEGEVSKDAEECYDAALSIAERLTEDDRSSHGTQHHLVMRHLWLGDLLVKSGDLAGAKVRYLASLATAERANEPWSYKAQQDLSVKLEELGDCFMDLVDDGSEDSVEDDVCEEAKGCYEAALSMAERLAGDDCSGDGAQHHLALRYAKVGDLRFKSGDLAGAKARYLASLNLAQRVDEPWSNEVQRVLFENLEELADCFLEDFVLNSAEECYKAALVIAEHFAAGGPSDIEAQRDLSAIFYKLGIARAKSGDLVEAKERYEMSLAIAKRLAADDPLSYEAQNALSVRLEKLGDVLEKIDDLAGAIACREQCLAIAERFARAKPHDPVLVGRSEAAGQRLAELRVSRRRAELLTGAVEIGKPLLPAPQTSDRSLLPERAVENQQVETISTPWDSFRTMPLVDVGKNNASALDVNVCGLEFYDLAVERTFDGTTPILLLSGEVRNIGRDEKLVPPVRVSLRDTNSREIFELVHAISDVPLSAGGAMPFQIRVDNPPSDAVDLEATFASFEELNSAGGAAHVTPSLHSEEPLELRDAIDEDGHSLGDPQAFLSR